MPDQHERGMVPDEAIRCAVRDKVKKAKFSFDLTDITTAKRTVVTGSATKCQGDRRAALLPWRA